MLKDSGEILIFDGAIATALFERGMRFDELPETFMLAKPDALPLLHREYRLAGAEILTTNTFNLTRILLEGLGVQDEWRSIIQTAVRAARSAGTGLIAGAIGPSGSSDFRAIEKAVFEQAKILDSEGVDAIILETLTDLDEAIVATKAVTSATDLPVIVNLTFHEFENKPAIDPKEAVKALSRLNPYAIGANCGADPTEMIGIVKKLRERWPGMICVEPSAGTPVMTGGILKWPITPTKMAEIALDLVKAGAGIIGTCCGSTPEYTAAIARALKP